MIPKRSFRLPYFWTLLQVLSLASVRGMVVARPYNHLARAIRCFQTRRMASSTSTALPEYEVEQKFALDSLDETTSRLKELGFEQTPNQVHMVDWYWDTDDDGWTLTCQDCWLRLRQVLLPQQKSGWQLKVRRPVSGGTAATVYEEIGGHEAIQKAVSLLSSSFKNDKAASMENSNNNQELLDLLQKETQTPIPDELKSGESSTLLVPFARIETKRSSWVPTDACRHPSLKVDLDTAIYVPDNTIYTVGEVEEVVHSQEDIANAKERVEKLIAEITDATKQSAVPVGKLEYYLMNRRPEHYQALVDSGVLK